MKMKREGNDKRTGEERREGKKSVKQKGKGGREGSECS